MLAILPSRLRPAIAWRAATPKVNTLPTRLPHSRNQSLVGHVAETNAADAELAIDRAGPAAQPAAHTNADALARGQLLLARLVRFDPLQVTLKLDSFRSRRHRF